MCLEAPPSFNHNPLTYESLDDNRQSFEIKANFGGLNGWPTDAAVVTYFPLQVHIFLFILLPRDLIIAEINLLPFHYLIFLATPVT
jgi:hypothetical protein